MKCVMADSALSILKLINKVTELKHRLMSKRTQQLSICLIQTQTVSGKELTDAGKVYQVYLNGANTDMKTLISRKNLVLPLGEA